MKKITFLLSLFFLLNINLKAQVNTEFKPENFDNKQALEEAQQNLLDGEDYFDDKSYYAAIPLLLKANDFNPNNANLNLKLGISYLHTNNKHKAFQHIEKARNLDPNISKKIDYYTARAYHYLLEFEKAIEYYNKYLPMASDQDEKAKVLKHIEECKNGITLREHRSVGLIVDIKEVNSIYADYSPMLTADESTMIFTSRRKNGSDLVDPYDMQYYENIFISHFKDNKWSAPQPISEVLNSKDHDANVGLSNDGQSIFVYNSNHGNGEIYKTDLDGSVWTKPIAVPSPINSPYTEKCISISPDKKTIYFVSDRPGGKGGLDIYYVEKDAEGNLGEVHNIGEAINTPYDEDGIFIHPDGKALYFSSKGHNTMGGYDIFKSVKDTNGVWSKPINLGQPINSADDDVFLFVSANGKTGYFSSIKEGGVGEKDIYKINFSEQDPGINESKLLLVKGKVIDALTQKPIEADIVIMDNTKQEEVAKFKSNKETGEFLVSLPAGKDYALTALSTDYLFYSENFNLIDSTSYLEISLKMEMSKLQANASSVLRNIFFDYGKSILKPASTTEIERLLTLLKAHPKMTLEISGHTDNISSKKFNQELSKKRANSVANYLIKKGIDRKRFTTKGYAFSKPIASNKTKEGRQRNRRVEFKILTY